MRWENTAHPETELGYVGGISLYLEFTACGGLRAVAHTLTKLRTISTVTSDA